MTSLFSNIKKNKFLKFYDTDTSESFIINDLIEDNSLENLDRSFVILYIDNSLLSIKIFLYFLKSHHAALLLSPNLDLELKKKLEGIYKPNIIYDPNRKSIKTFKKFNFLNFKSIFIKRKIVNYKIDLNIKLLLSTSGTTGSPKLVKLSENNILSNAISIASYLPINKNDVAPLNLPIIYSYGLSLFTSNSIYGGVIICTNRDILNPNFWKDFEKFKYSTISGVPATYEMLNRIGFLKNKYKSLKYMTQAGGRLNPKTKQIFYDYAKKNNISFYIMYGQTEATARMSFLSPKVLGEKINSIGKPILNGNFLIDRNTNELLYSGPNVFGGYAKNINDLSFYNKIDFLRTGDIARKDKDGYYYITGRLKRFIKLSGLRINLDEIEMLLQEKYKISDIYSIMGENEYLVIIIKSKLINDFSTIKSFLREKLNIHPKFVFIKIVKTVPLNQNGKVDYFALSKIK